MAIRFKCGECGKNLSAKDDRAGRSAKCPGCGVVVVVPAAEPRFGVPGGVYDVPLADRLLEKLPTEELDTDAIGFPNATRWQIPQTAKIALGILGLAGAIFGFLIWGRNPPVPIGVGGPSPVGPASNVSTETHINEEIARSANPAPEGQSSSPKPSKDAAIVLAKAFIHPYLGDPEAMFVSEGETIENGFSEDSVVVKGKAQTNSGQRVYEVSLLYSSKDGTWIVFIASMDGTRVYVRPEFASLMLDFERRQKEQHDGVVLDSSNPNHQNLIRGARNALRDKVRKLGAFKIDQFSGDEKVKDSIVGTPLVFGTVTVITGSREETKGYAVVLPESGDASGAGYVLLGKTELFVSPEVEAALDSQKNPANPK